MSGCFVGRKGESYGAKTPLEAGSQRGPALPGVGAAPQCQLQTPETSPQRWVPGS